VFYKIAEVFFGLLRSRGAKTFVVLDLKALEGLLRAMPVLVLRDSEKGLDCLVAFGHLDNWSHEFLKEAV
jgi:hypothetical protein